MSRVKTLASLLLAAGFLIFSAPAWAQKAGEINYALDWVISGRHSMYFLALEKGYYKAEGLNVKIHRGYGSADGIKRVITGVATFAFSDVSSLVVAQARENIQVMCVAAIYSNAPHGITYVVGKGIKTPKDLAGKKIGTMQGSAIRILFPAFAKKNGIDESKITWVNTDAANLPALLGTGNIDGAITYPMDTATWGRRFAPQGMKLSSIQYKDYGVELYSNGIVATTARVKNNPDQVGKFVRATVRGLAAAFNNPEEAVDMLLKTNPSVDRALAVPEVGIVRDLVLSDEALLYGIGYMTKEKMKATRDLMLNSYNLKADVKIENLYTNAFLPQRGR